MQQQQRVQQHWVRRAEHLVLRVVSLGFSLASAHAIRWFFAPLDRVDVLQPLITWVVAIGFGLLGYFVSRGLAHRLMNKERVRAYLPICLVVELVEVVCNYALAAGVIQQATWLATIPANQRSLLTSATYLVLSIIPLVSVLLAVVDMDLERKQDRVGTGGNQTATRAPGMRPAVSPQNGASAYGRGYQGNTPAIARSVNTDQNGKQGGGFKFPFAPRGGDAQAVAQPKDSPSSVRNMMHDPEKELVMP